jgi:predicted nuclease of predicted toxin-antitoxin system
MPQPDTPKIHLNEHISPRLADQLRKHGFDVTSSQESSLLSEPDDKQLEFAAAERRAIVTFNVSDFMALHESYLLEGREHWGIIFSSREPIHVLFRRLLKLLQTVPAYQLKNQARWLNDFN